MKLNEEQLNEVLEQLKKDYQNLDGVDLAFKNSASYIRETFTKMNVDCID